MSCDIEAIDAQTSVFRVAKGDDPWRFTPWEYAKADRLFDGRFDDPEGEYRVLYACSQRLGAFMEALAPFRSDEALEAELAEVELDGEESGERAVPLEWVGRRSVGAATLRGCFAVAADSRSLAFLGKRIGDVRQYGVKELDAAAIREQAHRALAQRVSRIVFECTDAEGAPQFDGISYRSRLGDELHNWALFERGEAPLDEKEAAEVEPDDRDLTEALERLGLQLG